MTICKIAVAVAAFTYSTPLLTVHRVDKKKAKACIVPNATFPKNSLTEASKLHVWWYATDCMQSLCHEVLDTGLGLMHHVVYVTMESTGALVS